jgi:bifunctional enzyme CysN/CysC
MDLLRFATAGSVDDGKSTLIGRLLYETKAVFQDHLDEVHRISLQTGEPLNLALLTDGLRAEREQGITIDVAYRYFATPNRKFIVADTPGHAQYTRNMITGTSTADLAIVLVDAARGVTEQSRRHLYVASLVRVPHVVVCINKMDLADYDEAVYERLREEVAAFAGRLTIRDLVFIPVAALHGENVVERSERMPWYNGPALLPYLETLEVERHTGETGARFPVQLVQRPAVGAVDLHRRYAGAVAGSVLRPGDPVVVLPTGLESRVRSIETYDGPLAEAAPPSSVALTLDDELDISRGDMICARPDPATVGDEITADLCWMAQTPLKPGNRYALKHTTRSVRAVIQSIAYRVDVNTLARDTDVEALALNEVGRVTIKTTAPLVYDSYARNRTTGSLILIDEATNVTVAAGMIAGDASSVSTGGPQ